MQKTGQPTACLLPFRFDPERLQADLSNVKAQNWQIHFNTSIFEGDWSGVPLRAVEGSHAAIYSDPNPNGVWSDTTLLGDCPYFQEVLSTFNCPLLSVRLLRLGPNAIIKEHRDYALGMDYGEVRIHIVIVTNPAVECRIGDQNYCWREGECWYGDFSQTHRFANKGQTERVHMVLDCTLNNWLRDLIDQQSNTLIPVVKAEPAVDATLALDSLRQMVYADPALQERLFSIRDPENFLSALSHLAEARGQGIDQHEIRAASSEGRRAWIERNLL